jgi:pilus assembly protein Flp/PilA
MLTVVRFLKAESGATAVEYGLVAGLIAIGIIAAAQGIGRELQVPFQAIDAGLKNSG